MIIGVPKEIKPQENRVAITPSGVDAFVRAGHPVYIEKNAGIGSGFSDEEYMAVGAKLLGSAKEIYDIAEMIMKVKEPLESECKMLKENQILFTYLHLAPDAKLTKALVDSKIIGIAYETVQLESGELPLLAPMSAVAGRMAVQIGSTMLESNNGGCGMLLGGVPGVQPASVVVIGGGVVGTNALKIAVGMGANVTVLDVSDRRLAYLDDLYSGRIITLMSNSYNIERAVKDAHLVIGAVLVPGAQTPKLVKEYMVKQMQKGAALVDVAIDQGGSIETMDRITTHKDPCYVKHGVVHYSVANMPGAVARTSTFALTNATLPYALKIASHGAESAMLNNVALLRGLNIYKGNVTYKAVADATGLPYVSAETVLK